MKSETNWSEWLREKAKECTYPAADDRFAWTLRLGVDSARAIADEIEGLRREAIQLTEERDECAITVGELLAKQNLLWKPLLAAMKAHEQGCADYPDEHFRNAIAACEEEG